MKPEEFSNQFDIYYNNITSNQAPGLTEYEKSVFLTRALDEIIKNYFTATSKGNTIGLGFDDSAKRQADFSVLMKTSLETKISTFTGSKIDQRSIVYKFPTDVFIPINEALFKPKSGAVLPKYFLVIPLRYDEYTRYMSKPFKRPRKNEVWRLINSGTVSDGIYNRYIELITSPDYDGDTSLVYEIRYIRRPRPIILGNIDDLTINGYTYNLVPSETSNPKRTNGECELDPILHEDILQRAVELAKIAWTVSGNENTEAVLLAGVRSE